MQFNKALIWSYINGQAHPSLNDEEKKIMGGIPLVATLFPGVNYYSISGFGQVREQCVVPALKKLFPELQSLLADDVKDGEKVEVTQFLPSKGYEWQDSSKWQAKFKKLLAAV